MKAVTLVPFRCYRSITQVAELLGLPRKEVVRLVYDGPLVAEKRGRRIRIHSDDLAAFQASEGR